MGSTYIQIEVTREELRKLSLAAELTKEKISELAKIGALAQAEMVLELEAEHDKEMQ